jgi:tetratricopeptide (TPR) repeat protein
VAVFTFRNLTGKKEHDWVGTAFAEALTEKLACLDTIHTRNRRELADLIGVHVIDPAELSPGALGGLAKKVHCDLLVFGAVQSAGGVESPETPLRATARLVDVRTGAIGEGVIVDGAIGKLPVLQTRMALEFAMRLNPEISEAERVQMARRPTGALDAYKAYCEGVAYLDAGAHIEAIGLFRDAKRLHPGILYAGAHHALGTALLRSGRREEMLAEFTGDVERLVPIWYQLGTAAAQAGDHARAVEALKTFVLYTDSRHAPWRRRVPPSVDSLYGGPDGRILLQTSDGGLLCLDRGSGRQIWREAPGQGGSRIVLGPGVFCRTTAGGALECGSLRTGEVRWSVRLQRELQAGPVLHPTMGLVTYVLDPGEVVCADLADGTVRWQVTVDDRATCLLALERTLAIGCAGAEVMLRDLETKRMLWRRRLPMSPRGLLRASGDLVALDRAGTLHRLGGADGEVLWSKTDLSTGGPLPVAVIGDLVVTRQGRRLRAYGKDGSVAWTQACRSESRILPAAEGVAVHAGGRTLRLLDARAGRSVSARRFDGRILSVITQGRRAVVLLEEGVVQAVRLGAAQEEPTDLDGYLRLGSSLLAMGMHEEARRTYLLVLEEVEAGSLEAAQGYLAACRKLADAALIEEARRRLQAVQRYLVQQPASR